MTCKTRKQTKKKLLRHNRRQHQHARTHAETHEKSRDVKTEKKKRVLQDKKERLQLFFLSVVCICVCAFVWFSEAAQLHALFFFGASFRSRLLPKAKGKPSAPSTTRIPRY